MFQKSTRPEAQGLGGFAFAQIAKVAFNFIVFRRFCSYLNVSCVSVGVWLNPPRPCASGRVDIELQELLIKLRK